MNTKDLCDFVNSLMQGLTVREKLKAFQIKCKKRPTGLVTQSWARGFRD